MQNATTKGMETCPAFPEAGASPSPPRPSRRSYFRRATIDGRGTGRPRNGIPGEIGSTGVGTRVPWKLTGKARRKGGKPAALPLSPRFTARLAQSSSILTVEGRIDGPEFAAAIVAEPAAPNSFSGHLWQTGPLRGATGAGLAAASDLAKAIVVARSLPRSVRMR